MTLEGLMQKGRKDCSTLENVADGFLYCPRKLWLGKKVSARKDANAPEVIKARSYRNSKWLKPVIFIAGPIFLASSAVALPFWGIGLALKEIVILSDSKAKDYHQIVELTIKNKGLRKQISLLETQLISRPKRWYAPGFTPKSEIRSKLNRTRAKQTLLHERVQDAFTQFKTEG